MVVENVAQNFTTIDRIESVIMLCKDHQGDNITVKCDVLKDTTPKILYFPKIGAGVNMNIDVDITEVTFHISEDEWDNPNEEFEDFFKHFVKE